MVFASMGDLKQDLLHINLVYVCLFLCSPFLILRVCLIGLGLNPSEVNSCLLSQLTHPHNTAALNTDNSQHKACKLKMLQALFISLFLSLTHTHTNLTTCHR